MKKRIINKQKIEKNFFAKRNMAVKSLLNRILKKEILFKKRVTKNKKESWGKRKCLIQEGVVFLRTFYEKNTHK